MAFSKSLAVGLAAVGLLAVAALPAEAQDEQDCPTGDLPQSGTITAEATTVGFIVGVRWGEGVLTLNDGSEHKFHFEGAKIIETGAAKVHITGKVFNLEKPEDFPGDYAAIAGGLTVIKGITGGAIMKNKNCVYINAEAESEGLRLSAPAPGGVLVSFSDE